MLAHVGYVPLRVSPYLGPASFRPTYGESGPSDDCVAWWMSSMWPWVWKKRKSAKGHYRFWAFASWAAVSSIWHAAVSGEASCILLSLWLWKLTWSQEPKTPRTIHPLFSIILKVDKITLYYEFTSVLRTPWILSHFLPKSNNMVGNHTTKNTMHDIKFKEQKKKKKKKWRLKRERSQFTSFVWDKFWSVFINWKGRVVAPLFQVTNTHSWLTEVITHEIKAAGWLDWNATISKCQFRGVFYDIPLKWDGRSSFHIHKQTPFCEWN